MATVVSDSIERYVGLYETILLYMNKDLPINFWYGFSRRKRNLCKILNTVLSNTKMSQPDSVVSEGCCNNKKTILPTCNMYKFCFLTSNLFSSHDSEFCTVSIENPFCFIPGS